LKKLYEGTIFFRIIFEVDKFFGFITKEYNLRDEIDLPYVVYADNKETAEKQIKLSKFWKTEILSEFIENEYDLEKGRYSFEEKTLSVKEIVHISFASLMNKMLSRDFIRYILDEIYETGI